MTNTSQDVSKDEHIPQVKEQLVFALNSMGSMMDNMVSILTVFSNRADKKLKVVKKKLASTKDVHKISKYIEEIESSKQVVEAFINKLTSEVKSIRKQIEVINGMSSINSEEGKKILKNVSDVMDKVKDTFNELMSSSPESLQ